MKKDGFPSKEEFYKTVLRLKREREIKKEGEYLGYLKEQRMMKKARSNKNNTKHKLKGKFEIKR